MKQIKMHIVEIRHTLTKDKSETVEKRYVKLGTDYHKGWGLPAHKHTIVSEKTDWVEVFEVGDRVVCDVKRGMVQDEDGINHGGEWISKPGIVQEAFDEYRGYVKFENGDHQIMSLIRGDMSGYPGNNMQAEKIIKNDDGTVTVVNARIRVTTSEEDFKKYGRATILSDAMRQLGNASELKLIESEPITEDQVRAEAYDILVFEYLKEHCHYDLQKTLIRMHGGHRMSRGMQNDVDEARAYADGIMFPISNDQLMRRMSKLMAENKGRYPHPRELKKIRLQRNLDGLTADAAIEAACKTLQAQRKTELGYRDHFANFRNDWKIEIIGDMPEQIGTCRYV